MRPLQTLKLYVSRPWFDGMILLLSDGSGSGYAEKAVDTGLGGDVFLVGQHMGV
ncbi:hypothetical protein ACXX82_07175 [Glaciimonas sp. GNP009]